MALCVVIMPCFATAENYDTYTPQAKEYLKQAQKQAKKEAKIKKKEGWKAENGEKLETLLTKHLLLTKEFGGKEITLIGTADGIHSMLRANTSARFSAIRRYTKQRSMKLNDRLLTQEALINEDLRETIVDGFEARLALEIANYIKESYSIYRMDDGSYDVTAYYLIDDDSLIKATQNAIDNEAKVIKLEPSTKTILAQCSAE